MDLWIRSQKGYGLMKPDTIGIEKSNGEYKIWNYKNTQRICLGEYNTEERALKILDDIQDWIANINRIRNSGIARDNTNEAYDETYQMPKE